jgi:hypothetical protein
MEGRRERLWSKILVKMDKDGEGLLLGNPHVSLSESMEGRKERRKQASKQEEDEELGEHLGEEQGSTI